MMHLRGFGLLLLVLPGGARRSIRFGDSHHGAQQQTYTLANGLGVSAESQEMLIPGVFPNDLFRPGGPRAGAPSGPKEGQFPLRNEHLLTSHRLQRAGAAAMKAKDVKKKKDVQVMLMAAVKGLGKDGDIVSVKRPYAEFLLRDGLVTVVTAEKLKQIQETIAAKKAAAAAQKEEAKQKALTLDRKLGNLGSTGVLIEKNVRPDGSIFGSVSPSEVAELIQARAGIAVDKKNINIPAIQSEGGMTLPPQKPGQAAIKVVGTTIAEIKLHPEVVSKLKITIVEAK